MPNYQFLILIALLSACITYLTSSDVIDSKIPEYGASPYFIYSIGFVENFVILSFFCFSAILSKLWAMLLLLASVAAGFAIKNYGVEISQPIIESVLATNLQEVSELIDQGTFVYFILYAPLSILLVLFIKIKHQKFLQRVFSAFVVMVVLSPLYIAPYMLDRNAASQSQKLVDFYFLPTSVYLNTYEYLRKSSTREIIPVAERNKIEELYSFTLDDKNEDVVIVLVIGESTRSDHLHINGYDRDNMPKLSARDDIVTYINATSCATRTIFSISCMLSHLSMSKFSLPQEDTSLVSVFKSLGFKTFWLSKHHFTGKTNCIEADTCMMHNDIYKKFRDRKLKKYDTILLNTLDEAINETGKKFIVLNIMGSHVDYHSRLPNKNYAKYTPICDKAVYECSKESLINSYDNTIIYLDHFLNEIFKKLAPMNAAVLYTSDHGESLGEMGVYMHSKPNFIAPKAQRHVPFILWSSENFYKYSQLKSLFDQKTRTDEVSHDNIFHSLLDCAGISSDIVEKDKSVCAIQ